MVLSFDSVDDGNWFYPKNSSWLIPLKPDLVLRASFQSLVKGKMSIKFLNVVNKFKISVAIRDATAILLKRILILYNYQIEAITQVLYISFIIKLR